MTRPEFGNFPADANPVMFWGARAIISRYDADLDIPRDRQSFCADDLSCKDDFMFWLNHTAIPRLCAEVKKRRYETGYRIEFTSDSGMFKCRAEDRNSGGYLYIGAWKE